MAIARAPSNIALVKYMGKDDSSTNLPANSSLSMTLSGLCTYAEVLPRGPGAGSIWVPEAPRVPEALLPRARSFERAQPLTVPDLSESGIARILRHLARVQNQVADLLASFGLSVNETSAFEVRTANTFPAASGIASSASSFAAVTLAAAQAHAAEPEAFARAYQDNVELRRALARLSRQGSGSSCRSFEGPWVLWERDSAAAIRTQMPELADFVLLVGKAPKQVSSSEAHSLVKTSPLWDGRADRVGARIRLLEAALGEGDLATVSRIAWAELWEMHSLFHTCSEPFTYWEPGTLEALNWLRRHLDRPGAPIVTMDAGPNVHVLVPVAEAERWAAMLRQNLSFEVLADSQGTGAALGSALGSGAR